MIRISIARPLALSLVLGLSVAGLASAAHAGVTYDYETDVAPHLQTPHAVPGQMQDHYSVFPKQRDVLALS